MTQINVKLNGDDTPADGEHDDDGSDDHGSGDDGRTPCKCACSSSNQYHILYFACRPVPANANTNVKGQ